MEELLAVWCDRPVPPVTLLCLARGIALPPLIVDHASMRNKFRLFYSNLAWISRAGTCSSGHHIEISIRATSAVRLK